jgi:hypothetical protein
LEQSKNSQQQAPLLAQFPNFNPKRFVFLDELREVANRVRVLLQQCLVVLMELFGVFLQELALVFFALPESALSFSVLSSAPHLSRRKLAPQWDMGVILRTALGSVVSRVVDETEGARDTVGVFSRLGIELSAGMLVAWPCP